MKSRRKPKFEMLRFRKNDHEHNLLTAVQRYVHAKGGSIVVIGGVEVQDWAEGMGKFRVAVRCLGKAPEKQSREQPPAEEQ